MKINERIQKEKKWYIIFRHIWRKTSTYFNFIFRSLVYRNLFYF